jgi:hypothetical protein
MGFPAMCFTEASTSFAVTGVPSEKVAPSRSVMVHTDASSLGLALLASCKEGLAEPAMTRDS